MVKALLNISRKIIPYVLVLVVFVALAFISYAPAHATTGINQQINFQGRLLTAAGATVPDGFYNIQFKIYQDGDGLTAGDTTGAPTGALMWTESYLNASAQGVTVVNGFLSVQLGSISPLSTINWNQSTLWLSMNIGGINGTCTPFTSCTPDGEMLPMKRLSSSAYSINSGLLGGLSSAAFIQLAQGVQTDASTSTNSIYINKTGTGNIINLQSGGTDSFIVTNTGDQTFGANANHTISVATAAAATTGKSLSIVGGAGGTGTGSAGGNLVLQAGSAGGTTAVGGNVTIDAGAAAGATTAGNIAIGGTQATTITLGNTTLAAGTQTINIGTANTAGGTTNVTVGNGALATAGTTTIQAKTSIGITVNGTVRGTFDNANNLYLGNGVTAPAPNNFVITGTGSSTTAIAGGAVTLQGGNATVGSASGGNLTLTGGNGIGTGVNGLVVITTPTFSTTINDANCYTSGALVTASCTIAATTVNNSSAVIVGFSTATQTATLPNPTTATAGRIVYVTAANGSNDFTLSVNGGGTGNLIAMRQNTSATMIWNGTAWTAAGASSSTTLQSAYNNTLQSAGGAELVVSKTSNTNGLTIRDSSTNPVNGTLLSVQTASAAGLFSVNGNVTEYTSDSGAEVAGGTAITFPAVTWSAVGSSTIARYNTAGNFIATGQGSVSTTTTTAANDGVKNTLVSALSANTNYNLSFTARLSSGTFTDMNVYYSVDGTTASVPCIVTGQAVPTSIWTKVNCTFAAPASGITASNAILIRQTGSGTARTFYVDNLSVTIAANYNYATDGGVDNAGSFSTNWPNAAATSVARSTTVGNDASDSAQVNTPATTGTGIRNLLSVNPLPSTLYRVTAYVASSTTGFNSFTVRYSRDGGTNFVACADYNTQAISSSVTAFTLVTCYITTDATAANAPNLYFTQGDAVARTFYVDTVSFNINSNGTPNVQIGGGLNGGPVTLLTLDRGASAPIASNNDSLLGSMYYDTTLGKLQCYESDGWGACGSSADNIVTISPEYTNAVLHGTGVGTMTSDLCSATLGINDGSLSQPTICGANETYNFYKWTSPQASTQAYSIYVTYQLPSTFKAFASGQTSVQARVDNTTNASVQLQIYKNAAGSALATCGANVTITTTANTWQAPTASGTADPSTCSFIAGNSIVFKITTSAFSNANAYVANLNFRFSNK